jgi:hypothetical protein
MSCDTSAAPAELFVVTVTVAFDVPRLRCVVFGRNVIV